MILRPADPACARGSRTAIGKMEHRRLADPAYPPRILHRHRGDGAGGMILRFADPAYAPGPCTAIGTMERAA